MFYLFQQHHKGKGYFHFFLCLLITSCVLISLIDFLPYLCARGLSGCASDAFAKTSSSPPPGFTPPEPSPLTTIGAPVISCFICGLSFTNSSLSAIRIVIS